MIRFVIISVSWANLQENLVRVSSKRSHAAVPWCPQLSLEGGSTAGTAASREPQPRGRQMSGEIGQKPGVDLPRPWGVSGHSWASSARAVPVVAPLQARGGLRAGGGWGQGPRACPRACPRESPAARGPQHTGRGDGGGAGAAGPSPRLGVSGGLEGARLRASPGCSDTP